MPLVYNDDTAYSGTVLMVLLGLSDLVHQDVFIYWKDVTMYCWSEAYTTNMLCLCRPFVIGSDMFHNLMIVTLTVVESPQAGGHMLSSSPW